MLKIYPISAKIFDLIFFPPENNPYDIGARSSVFFCDLIKFFRNKLVS